MPITIVDDAHGDFVIGNDGKGTPDHFKVVKKIDLYISSLSKGLGSFGGLYLSSHNNVIDLCINNIKIIYHIHQHCHPFLVEYSFKRFQSNREKQKRKLIKNTKQLIKGLKQLGFEINSSSQIIPIIATGMKKRQ